MGEGGANFFADLFCLRQAVLFELGEGELAIYGDFERGARPWGDFHPIELMVKLLKHLLRQTDGVL